MGSRPQSRGPGPVPDRWLRCPRKSVTLLQNKFLIFKTPLSEKFNDQVPDEYRFPVDFVFMSMKSYKVKVGLWIDLTNTYRFYDKSEVEKHDCKYVKLQCKGRGETPSAEQTQMFTRICDNFIKHHPLEIIGVHCTHGFNRSGFLVTSYLVTVEDWDLEAALVEFARVRPPGIYKQDYINELFKLYGDDQTPKVAPELPEWCLEAEEGDDSDGGEEEVSNNNKRQGSNGVGGRRQKKRRMIKENPTFMEGVTGVEPVGPPLLGEIQNKVSELCHYNQDGFPGSQPVSMKLSNINLLANKPYRVSWKADGTRYLMYIEEKNKVYCIDRDNCVFKVKNLSFPYRKDLNVHLKNTLLDGEMVIDTVNGEKVARYLVYDIITLLKFPISKEPFFPTRYQAISKEITDPRYEAIRRGMLNKEKESFSVRPKEFCDVREAGKFLSGKFCKTLTHEPDGLIFQPSQDRYQCGRCDSVLKWKPHTHNSIDFRLKIATEEGAGLLKRKIGELHVGSFDRPIARLKTIKNLQHLDNKIIECTFDGANWIFMRERTDKSFPNSYDTAMSVFESIKNPVTKEILLDFIDTQGYVETMPPPAGLPPRFHPHQ